MLEQLTPGADLMDALRAQINRGLMVAWINHDLINRADCDIRKSVVLYDADRVFVMAFSTAVTPDIFADRVHLVTASMSAMGVRYWSVGVL